MSKHRKSLCIALPQGHRLKNMNCKLIRELKTLHAENKLLLTGKRRGTHIFFVGVLLVAAQRAQDVGAGGLVWGSRGRHAAYSSTQS